MKAKKLVVVTNKIEDEAIDIIREVAPHQLEVVSAADLARAERQGDYSRADELDALLARAEIVYALKLPERLLERAPGLKWIQTISTGVERILTDELVHSDVVVTNMSGIHEVTMSEFVLMLMLMFAKGAPTSFYQQIEGRFKWFPMKVLPGRTVGIVGLGRIGKAVARVSKLHGMRVVGTSRTAMEDDSFENVDEVLPLSRLHDLLGQCDFVVLALPLTAESAHLIAEAELRAMNSEGHLINVARGGVVDEPALVEALKEGWIAGAGLDVFETEPLSADSPLRHLPNVIFSPHVSGDIAEYDVGAAGLFADNLRRYLAGEPLVNIVDKACGY
ncbi:MAG: D-2-hydroxyacid dehydrogenase [Dehalococcoidia bacterium]|nr:D-2-hydroxyacid dehydrogenase [Dehalococcoidia bacterium]